MKQPGERHASAGSPCGSAGISSIVEYDYIGVPSATATFLNIAVGEESTSSSLA